MFMFIVDWPQQGSAGEVIPHHASSAEKGVRDMRSMGTMARGGISRDFSGSDKMPLGRERLNLRALDIS